MLRLLEAVDDGGSDIIRIENLCVGVDVGARDDDNLEEVGSEIDVGTRAGIRVPVPSETTQSNGQGVDRNRLLSVIPSPTGLLALDLTAMQPSWK
jgi:hypothetical protein